LERENIPTFREAIKKKSPKVGTLSESWDIVPTGGGGVTKDCSLEMKRNSIIGSGWVNILKYGQGKEKCVHYFVVHLCDEDENQPSTLEH
jgi:hypothetical protein